MLALVVAVGSAAGCRPKSELTGRQYTHHGLEFALAVPEGWSLTELDGNLAVKLEAPASANGQQAVAHVFCRDEWDAPDAAAVVDEMARLLGRESSVLTTGDAATEGEPKNVKAQTESITVSGLPAYRLTRTVTTRTAMIREEMVVVTRGKRAWGLVVSRPEAADEATREAADQLVKSFEIR
jgi:hypothetical protein